MKANATRTAKSGIARRPQDFDEEFDEGLADVGAELGGAALDDAAAADEDAPDALEFAADDGLICSC
jgi:hypothetical protein